MAAQRRNYRDWTPKEKTILAAIQNDPEICNKTWEFKTDEFNKRVHETEPDRPKRTMHAVYQQWKVCVRDHEEDLTAASQTHAQTQSSSSQYEPIEEIVDGYSLNFDNLSAQEKDEIFNALGLLYGES